VKYWEIIADNLIDLLLKKLPKSADEKKAVKNFFDSLRLEGIDFTHRHYVRDDEYIGYGEDIAVFLQREIAKPIVQWEDSPQLGYEILPNKYFYRYEPPTPAKELLAEFWKQGTRIFETVCTQRI
jgi:type I restriction enzyme M protein